MRLLGVSGGASSVITYLFCAGRTTRVLYIHIQTHHTIPRHSSTAMSMRNTSGKFTIPFGRKSDKTPASPTGTGPTHGRFFSSGGGSGDDDFGPGGEKGSGSGGLNLGKRIAHQRLIPGLGNQDLRQLQE
jgi:hypothetical protein